MCGVGTTMAPKKDESMLLADLREHIEWVEENVFMLQARAGVGLRGKLRQGGKGKEAQVYLWLVHYADRISSSFVLSLAVRALDARVNGETGTKAQDSISGRSRQRTVAASSSVGGRAILSAVRGGSISRTGLTNLGKTCFFINAMLQCLYHNVHVQHAVELSALGGSVMGDRLRELFRVRSECSATCWELFEKLVSLVESVFEN